MKYLLVSFKSRNSTFHFSKLLNSREIYNNIINTPKSIGSTCTLSIRTDMKYYHQILSLIKLASANDFLGLFTLERIGFSEQTQRLY